MEDEYTININASIYDKDLDDVGFEPEVINDSDSDLENKFGL